MTEPVRIAARAGLIDVLDEGGLTAAVETIADEELKGAIHSGLIASQDRLGRGAEAQALAEPLLAKHGYGEPASSLGASKRRKLAVLLTMMGRDDEAKQYSAAP